MTDRFLNIATIAAVSLQVAIGVIFFGALTVMTLSGFALIPAPF